MNFLMRVYRLSSRDGAFGSAHIGFASDPSRGNLDAKPLEDPGHAKNCNRDRAGGSAACGGFGDRAGGARHAAAENHD